MIPVALQVPIQVTPQVKQYRKRGVPNETLTCNICNIEKPCSEFKPYRHQCTPCFNKLQSDKQKIRVLNRQCLANREDLEFKFAVMTQLLA